MEKTGVVALSVSTPGEEGRAVGEGLRERVAVGPHTALAPLGALHRDDRHLDELHRRLAVLQRLRQVQNLKWGNITELQNEKTTCC